MRLQSEEQLRVFAQAESAGSDNTSKQDFYNDDGDRGLLRQIAYSGQQSESFMVCDLVKVRQGMDSWCEWMSPVQPAFDVFCNCLPTILCTLSELGCRSFFCRNSSEISTALEAGLDTSELIFAPPMIVGSQLKLATKLGVTKVAFQTEADLARIKQIAPNADLLLMVYPGQGNSSLAELLSKAKDLGLSMCGISVRSADDAHDAVDVVEATDVARRAFDEAEAAGHDNLTMLDLGLMEQPSKERGDAINAMVLKHFGSCPPLLTARANAALTGEAFILATRILDKQSSEDKFTLVLNEGVYGCFSQLLHLPNAHLNPYPLNDCYFNQQELVQLSKSWSKCVLLGPSDGSADHLGVFTLPVHLLDVGDWLTFEGMGAYVASGGQQDVFDEGFRVSEDDDGASEKWVILKKKSLHIDDEGVVPLLEEEPIALLCLPGGEG